MFEYLPFSDYHLTVNRVRRHHFQNEFYWPPLGRYFVNPFSCSSGVRRRLDFSFHSLDWGKIERWGDDPNLFSLCAKINVSLVSTVPLQWRREKNLEMGKAFLLGVEDKTSFPSAAPVSILSPSVLFPDRILQSIVAGVPRFGLFLSDLVSSLNRICSSSHSPFLLFF